MVSNFDFIIYNYMSILNYPLLVSILPLLITGLIYFFGKIHLSNYWQYHMEDKYAPFLHGINIINSFVFIPLMEIIVIYLLLFNREFFNTVSFYSLFILFLVLNIIQILGKQLIVWKKVKAPVNAYHTAIFNLNVFSEVLSYWKEYTILMLLKGLFPLVLYVSIYFVLICTYNPFLLLVIGFVWLLCMMFFSLIDAITEQHKKYDLVFKNKLIQKNVKIVEFLNDGKLLKYVEEDFTAKVVPIEHISEIILQKGDNNARPQSINNQGKAVTHRKIRGQHP